MLAVVYFSVFAVMAGVVWRLVRAVDSLPFRLDGLRVWVKEDAEKYCRRVLRKHTDRTGQYLGSIKSHITLQFMDPLDISCVFDLFQTGSEGR